MIDLKNIIQNTKPVNNIIKYFIAPTVLLNEKELKICNLLKDFTNFYNGSINNDPINNPLILRITGGWVRDKLLGQGSHDLDIAINILSGENFALSLNDFLLENLNKYDYQPHNIHKIKKNPDKSKHLETATTKLFDMDIDFVNLRSEEYTELSRIPVISFGTPLQDALRRDATLNALFYNINNSNIEDFTGQGLMDLYNGILRTPLPPRKTFLDDPLRILRLIRFAARFNFKIEDNVLLEMMDPKINESFHHKISRERIGNELYKIVMDKNPLVALSLIQKTNLENIIFHWHSNMDTVKFNEQTLEHSEWEKINSIYDNHILNQHLFKIVNELPSFVQKIDILKENFNIDDNVKQHLLLLSVTLLPFSKINVIPSPKKVLNNKCPIVNCIMKESLKFPKADYQMVTDAVENYQEYNNVVHSFNINPSSLSRSQIGVLLRKFKGHWKLIHFTAMVNELLYCDNYNEIKPTVIDNYNRFYDMIFEQELNNVHLLAPIYNGKQLQNELDLKPGKWLAVVTDEIIKWQLDNPTGSADELLKFVKSNINNFI